MTEFIQTLLLILIPALQPGVGHSGVTWDLSVQEDSIRAAIQDQRAKEMQWLKSSPTSYLAAVARVDFGERRTMTIGADASNDVVVEDLSFAAHHMSVTVVGDSFRVTPVSKGAVYTYRGDERNTTSVVPPSYITVGRFSIRLSHQRYPAIIVFDPDSPRFREYRGLEFFPVDLRYRFVLPLKRNPTPDTTVILSTRGNRRNALREGWFSFTVDGVQCTLEVNRLLEPGIGETMYSVFFTDRTTGKETYAVGRYIDVEKRDDGRFVVDFNLAYNPACAISPYYNCPLPPETNALSVRIPAGEMDAHYEHK